MVACANFGAGLVRSYCEACGQKRFVDSDRRFGHLARALANPDIFLVTFTLA